MDDKDMIIQGLEEGSELWKAEYDNCRALLQNIIDLNGLKLNYGSRIEGLDAKIALAWAAVRKFLEKYQHFE